MEQRSRTSEFQLQAKREVTPCQTLLKDLGLPHGPGTARNRAANQTRRRSGPIFRRSDPQTKKQRRLKILSLLESGMWVRFARRRHGAYISRRRQCSLAYKTPKPLVVFGWAKTCETQERKVEREVLWKTIIKKERPGISPRGRWECLLLCY